MKVGDELRRIADKIDADVYLFNGTVHRSRDLDCMEKVKAHAGHKRALVLLVTNGGDPDSAYKIARYFQDKYEVFSLLISGVCKSAGTLIAIGAHELIFTPYGELGPLDIQLTKVDRFDQMQSGLTIQDALTTLEQAATRSFQKMIADYIQANGGLISFATASKAASDFVTQLYSPILQRIDPEEVGARSRSMRIAVDYGRRLSIKASNLKSPNTLNTLAETYSSHSFVIDEREAATLFERVRSASDNERELVMALGPLARMERGEVVFEPLSTCRRKSIEVNEGSLANGESNGSRGSEADGGNSAEPVDAPKPAPATVARRRSRAEKPLAVGNGRAG